jgi:predicted GTPase
VNSLTILVMGKGGVGKSSTVNSIIGERVVAISPFQVILSCDGLQSGGL